jgi:hypothetical protein
MNQQGGKVRFHLYCPTARTLVVRKGRPQAKTRQLLRDDAIPKTIKERSLHATLVWPLVAPNDFREPCYVQRPWPAVRGLVKGACPRKMLRHLRQKNLTLHFVKRIAFIRFDENQLVPLVWLSGLGQELSAKGAACSNVLFRPPGPCYGDLPDFGKQLDHFHSGTTVPQHNFRTCPPQGFASRNRTNTTRRFQKGKKGRPKDNIRNVFWHVARDNRSDKRPQRRGQRRPRNQAQVQQNTRP